ncbi:MAG: transposase [Oscillospiraceae bacterium]|nr:transposase [Oscillospiraceae bacterium]
MNENELLPERKLHRLKSWDYSQNGYYFITVCTKDKRALLAKVGNAVPGVPKNSLNLHLTPIGKIVKTAWEGISKIDDNIKTDLFCIMPNHIHGIIIIENQEYDVSEAERRGRRSLQDIVRGFKSVSTREYNKIVPESEKNKLWQSSFYDEIIRNDQMLYEARKYIKYNHLKHYSGRLFKGNDL